MVDRHGIVPILRWEGSMWGGWDLMLGEKRLLSGVSESSTDSAMDSAMEALAKVSRVAAGWEWEDDD